MTTTSTTTPTRLRDQQPMGAQDVKDQARRLRNLIKDMPSALSSQQALEMMARIHGFESWGQLSAHLASRSAVPTPAVTTERDKRETVSETPPLRSLKMTAAEYRRRIMEAAETIPGLQIKQHAFDLLDDVLQLYTGRSGIAHVSHRGIYDELRRAEAQRIAKGPHPKRENWEEREQTAEERWKGAANDLVMVMNRCDIENWVSPDYPLLDRPNRKTCDITKSVYTSSIKQGYQQSFMPGRESMAIIYRDEAGHDAALESLRQNIPWLPSITHVPDAGAPAKEHVHFAGNHLGFFAKEEFSDATDLMLTAIMSREMPSGRSGMASVLSLPWRSGDQRYAPMGAKSLVERAAEKGVSLMLRVPSRDYGREGRVRLHSILRKCHVWAIASETIVPIPAIVHDEGNLCSEAVARFNTRAFKSRF